MAYPDINYVPLEFPDEIRLLHLEVEHFCSNSNKAWSIEHVRLSENPSYEALSYVWDQLPPSEIPDKYFRELMNRRSAIYHLRKLKSCVLWIDALCLYVSRYRTKLCGNLRFGPLFFEGLRFVLIRSISLSVYSTIMRSYLRYLVN
jgi:hypothetical protein